MLVAGIAYCALPWTPWGANYQRFEPQASPLGRHQAWRCIRFYGLSFDDVALFVDGERACGWLSDEGALADVAWVSENLLRVVVASRTRLPLFWWHETRIGEVQIEWHMESPGTTRR
jgi:hypothetical protein